VGTLFPHAHADFYLIGYPLVHSARGFHYFRIVRRFGPFSRSSLANPALPPGHGRLRFAVGTFFWAIKQRRRLIQYWLIVARVEATAMKCLPEEERRKEGKKEAAEEKKTTQPKQPKKADKRNATRMVNSSLFIYLCLSVYVVRKRALVRPYIFSSFSFPNLLLQQQHFVADTLNRYRRAL
jgi:hypothetical protein